MWGGRQNGDVRSIFSRACPNTSPFLSGERVDGEGGRGDDVRRLPHACPIGNRGASEGWKWRVEEGKMLKSYLFLTVHVRTRSLSPWLEGGGRARWGRANWGKVGR